MKNKFCWLIVIMSGFLTSCVAVESNTGTTRDYAHAQNNPLPYQSNAQTAVIYISQPYRYTDAYLVLATLGEGITYDQSLTYVINQKTHTRHFLGNLYRSTLCFYASPGNYQLLIKNNGISPKEISAPLHVNNGSVSFYALQSSDISKTLTFNQVTEAQGKFNIQQVPPKNCVRLERYSDRQLSDVNLDITLVNHTQHPMMIPPFNPLNPNQSYRMHSHYRIYSDSRYFHWQTLIKTPAINDSTTLSVNGIVDGLDHVSAKKIQLYVNAGESFGFAPSTKLRTQTHCHSSYQQHGVTIQCTISLIDIADLSRDPGKPHEEVTLSGN